MMHAGGSVWRRVVNVGGEASTKAASSSVSRRRRPGLGLALVLVLVSGCTGSLLESDLPVNSIYVLGPASVDGAPAASSSVDLSIGRPQLAPGLDTDRIAVLKGNQLDYYRASRWGARAAEVVQSVLVGSLESLRLFNSVTAEQARVAGDYVMDIEVRDFQAEYEADDAPPTVHVKIVGRLIRIVDRKLVDTITVDARRQTAQNRMGAVVASFESATQKVALDLAHQAAAAISGDEQELRAARGN
jgi:cholesterol transport system auxiliary component